MMGMALMAIPVAAGQTMALPGISVACVRETPGHASELGTQVLMGTPLRILDTSDGWVRIETPEGYRGYVIANSLVTPTDREFDNWRASERVVVTAADQTYVYASPEVDAASRVTDVVNGSVLQVADTCGGSEFVKVKVPFGREGYILRSEVTPVGEFGSAGCDKQRVIEFACRMMGQPYLWGGTSQKGVDCSGLTKAAYLSEGVILPRNASQQARIGVGVDKDAIDSFEPGDLLFFGNSATGRVNHVGLYMGDGRFIHCSGRVKVNSLRRGDAAYTPLSLLCVRRLDDATLSSLRLSLHEWYVGRMD